MIDCTGKNGPLFPFPLETELSPFPAPQRKCIVGYFAGIYV
ncbi:styrene monooxygenase/indole monooxygenase family protein [Peribacillus muralis]